MDVVIAEDEPLQSRLIEYFTGEEHTVVATATNGDEAIQYTTTHEPDVIIMDINMPVKGGVEAIEEIDAFDIDVGIVVSTAHVDDETREAAMSAGADAYLIKPFSKADLLEQMDRFSEA
ncbi:putative two-component system response regulator [Halorubrum sp. DM2]|uniref:response regulator n=1 Tax=Halorubrum sp. DM2 TaxID=2527867 RepID=UPI0024B68703|nr:response regulator [Halorubrum sp. DM2]VTT87310.1 putative two-component system response regulator [Halorubrum sp. DM2]